ncbi:MAG: hypothetical protein ABL930_04085, partial [Pseudobdellovibrio sp.]
VLKISVVLFILLALVVYKLNDYFKNEKLYSMQTQLHSKVVSAKTTVSSQLAQLKNTLSSYETELNDSNINWVQLDPFFAIAKLDKNNQSLRVNQMLVRSNTPAERWNSTYLERALSINKSKRTEPILTQLFQDRAGTKFLIIRFKIAANKELAVVGSADYFQKFFDLERGEDSTALLATTENVLAAHSEGDYIATQTTETKFTAKRYLFEKEEIVGTNLIAMNYILKKKIVSGFVVPWSIIGTVLGFGCILIAILFYSLDPIEKRVERYKKQERDQIYKDTVGGLVNKSNMINLANSASVAVPVIKKTETPAPAPIAAAASPVVKSEKKEMPKNFFDIASTSDSTKEVGVDTQITEIKEETKTVSIENHFEEEKTAKVSLDSAEFISLQDDKIDISDIEKALALDDFDSEEDSLQASADLEKNLTPQKISVSAMGATIDKPQFALSRKDFKVDEFKTNIRRPEKA